MNPFLCALIACVASSTPTLKEHCALDKDKHILSVSIKGLTEKENLSHKDSRQVFELVNTAACKNIYLDYTLSSQTPILRNYFDDFIRGPNSTLGFRGINFHVTAENLARLEAYEPLLQDSQHTVTAEYGVYIHNRKKFFDLASRHKFKQVMLVVNATTCSHVMSDRNIFARIAYSFVATKESTAAYLGKTYQAYRVYLQKVDRLGSDASFGSVNTLSQYK